MITRVLDEMKKLENNIKKAENGRMQAEAELVEVAMFKQASDDALESVVNDVKVQLIFFGQQLNSIDTIVTSKLSAAFVIPPPPPFFVIIVIIIIIIVVVIIIFSTY